MDGSAVAEPAGWMGTDCYEVLGCLGQGGMGVVYEAFDRERRQLVALKKLLRYDPATLYLFKQEFRTLADVRHTNLVHLYELVVAEGEEVFFTMELVRGVDFLQYARRARPVPREGRGPPAPAMTMRPAARDANTVRPAPDGPKVAIPEPARSLADIDRLRPALRQLVEGIHALHSAGKLHRDVKPSNVLVTPEGRLVLLDFGVATELRGHAGDAATSGEMVGTARYMAPEQAEDQAPVPASDWYSVGVMLYEALVGRPPFVGSTVDVLTMKSMLDATAPSECVEGVPPDLDALCRALLHRDPAMRPTGSAILRLLGVTHSSAPPSQLAGADAGTTFIGREGQLAKLRAAFDDVRAGRAVTVRVSGASGMGKSTLAHHFLDELASRGEAVVLRGRAYEREAVPYKAVDTVIDALSRHLLRMSEEGATLALPDDAWLLARLFPVLRRVPRFGELATQSVDDPQGIRRRAFGALRDLLASLAQRQPLVLFVDDAQWGDVDSASLLLDLVRPPEAPPVLLVMTCRDGEEAEASPFLREMRERWHAGADARDVTVEPLETAEAIRLVLSLLDASDELAQRTARAVARESRGSPFLIEELVRSNRGAVSATGATLAVLTLDQMVAERMERLPEPARKVIEIVAVGGRPLPVSVVAAASGVEDAINELVGFLSTRRLLRTGLRDGRDVVETTHDRIRETIVAQLPEAALRGHHGLLARALEHASGADAEAVALHWLGAGDYERAARLAEGAAEQAVAKLAFEQAVRLFRLTLEHTPASSPDLRRLRARLAEALRFAGRCQESARAYLLAAEGAPADQGVEFRRAAAEQFLSGGYIDEGKEILHQVLAAVGMSAPRSPLAAVFWLVVYRLWLRLIGLRIKERSSGEVTPADRLRIEALATVAVGFSVVDVILGACMGARHVIDALRAGDRFQVARAMSLEAAQIAASGGRETRRERDLNTIAAGLTEREGSDDARFYLATTRGIGLFNRGHWRAARELLDRANQAIPLGRAGLSNSHLFAIYAHTFMGDLAETRKRTTLLCAQAEDRGDLYIPVNLKTGTSITLALADGDPALARRGLDEAMAQWSQSGFHVQHWQAVVYGADIDAYEGDSGRAYERVNGSLPALKKSLLLHSGFVRTMTAFTRGRLAIESIASHPALKARRIEEARRMARTLAREHDPWAGVVACLLTAAAENAAGNRPGALEALRAGVEKAMATDSVVYVMAARYRLGQMLGGDEGRAMTRGAIDATVAMGGGNPERWLALQIPGEWSAPQ